MLKRSFAKAGAALVLSVALAGSTVLPAPGIVAGLGAESAYATIVEGDEEYVCVDDNGEYVIPVYESGDYAYALTGEFHEKNVAHEGDAVIVAYLGTVGSELVVPGELDGHKVAAVGNDYDAWCPQFETYGSELFVFRGSADLERVVLPEGLETIGSRVFEGCAKLASVEFPSTLRYIRNEAFSGCAALSSVTFPDGFSYVGAQAFAGTAIKRLSLPASFKATHTLSFAGMPELEKVVFSEGLETIGSSYVFANSPKIKSITLPSTLADVRPSAFRGCTAVKATIASAAKRYSVKKGVLIDEKKHKILHAFASLGSTFTVPKGVTSIGDHAFEGNTSIKKLVVNKDCKTIGFQAFSECGKLKTAVLSGKLKTIGDSAFYLTGLTKLTLGSKVKTVGSRAFELKAKAGAKKSPLRSVKVPKSVKGISAYAFGCYLGSDGRCKVDKTFKITCKKGSAAAKYAKKNGMKVKYA